MSGPGGGRSDRAALLAEDREARRAAQSEFEHPVVLEAGAGTGKTTTLVARVLAWTLGRGWQRVTDERPDDEEEGRERDEAVAVEVLEGVVSITFTEAAAAEMESRIAAALSRVAAGETGAIHGLDARVAGLPPDEVAASRARALLAAFDHLTVRTIHAYCLNLLSRHPLSARLHPTLTVDADGSIVEELVGEVVEGDLRRAYTGDAETPLIHLARRGVGPRRIAEALRLLVARGLRSAQLIEEPFDGAALGDLRERLRRPLERLTALVGERFAGLPANMRAPAIAEAARRSLADVEGADAAGAAAMESLRNRLEQAWPRPLLDHLKAWRKGKIGKKELSALDQAAAELPPAAAELRAVLRHVLALEPLFLDRARQALGGLLRRIEGEMRSRGVITFDGLLDEVLELLRSHPHVRRRERQQIDQLLVDEFQDTDRRQCDLVRLLALGGGPSRRPGLFVVGDPKQSIYGWRSADLEAYESFVAEALAAGGRRCLLVENFRSAAPILAEVDRAVAPVMRRRAGLQPDYEPLLACEALRGHPGFDRAGHAPVEHWVAWLPPEEGEHSGERTGADDAAELEARAIAADISRLHRDEGTAWGDFALLLRSTGRLDTFLEAFRSAGVPFAVARDKNYYRRREVIEAAALLRAIVLPTDHLALLTYLRSATVGVPDAALIPLWGRGFPDKLTELTGPDAARLGELREVVRAAADEVPTDIPGIESLRGWPRSLLAGIEALAHLRSSFRTDPADRFVEHLRSWVLLEATAAARYLGAFRVANLERFLRQIERALDDGGGDAHAVLRALRRSVGEAREAEEALPGEAALAAVQVLTIHAAKGLEFDHVYLPQLHAGTGERDERQIDSDEHWAPGLRLEYKLFGCATAGFDRVLRRRAEVERAERVRLLYVAMTRARRRLVLSACWPARPAPVEDSAVERPLDLLTRREPPPPDLEELLTATRESGGHTVRVAEALWCFPGHAAHEAPASTRRAAPDWLPDGAATRRAGERLAEMTAAARLRMRRPFGEAASREAGERLRALAREGGGDGDGGGAREVALHVGTAVHRLLETWDLEAEVDDADDLARELDRRRAEAESWLRAGLAEELADEAARRLRRLVRRLARGRLLRRFLELRPRIVARELPIVAPPPSTGEGAVGYLSGAIDLVYRRRDGGLAIVDYKTDELQLDLEIEARAAAYAGQEEIYAAALQSALGLETPPACELWFLWPDRRWTIAAGGGRPGGLAEA